jgi:iduronate 2-sulfatase
MWGVFFLYNLTVYLNERVDNLMNFNSHLQLVNTLMNQVMSRCLKKMRAKQSIQTVSIAIIGVLTLGLPAIVSAVVQDNRPNILMIVIDDLNDWVGVMNAHPNALTPNIDNLAEQGVLFANAHAAAPLCAPTRAAILSGLRPSTTGIYAPVNFAVYDQIKTNPYSAGVTLLPEYFSQHGYKTMATGKIYHEGSPVDAFHIVGQHRRDFGPYPDERISYTPPPGRSTSTDWGVFPENDEDMPDWQNAQWVIDQLNEQHDQPFFMSVGFVRPHVPWFASQKWFDMHPLQSIILPFNKENQVENLPETSKLFAHKPAMPQLDWMKQEQRWEKSVQAYLASTTFVDHCVGMVTKALENSRYAENTIIILFSDHGYHLGEKGIWAKQTLWERSTRIPLIIVKPDNEPTVVNRPVNHIDIYPTLLELAGLPANPTNEGKSLVPLMHDPESPGFYASITTHGYKNHGVRTDRWRLIQYSDGTEELYDHWNDPNEWRNLAALPRYETILQQLRSYLPKINRP